jgi:hypothetical protein
MERGVEISGAQFKKLVTLGRVTHIEGSVDDVNTLRIGRMGTIRPPMVLLPDDAEVTITDIQIVTDVVAGEDDNSLDLVVFNLHEVAALVKLL